MREGAPFAPQRFAVLQPKSSAGAFFPNDGTKKSRPEEIPEPGEPALSELSASVPWLLA